MPHRLRNDFSVGDAIGYSILWIILVICTLGLALFVLPYYFTKTVINKTAVLDDRGAEIGRLSCNLTLGTMIGNAIIWLLLTLVTLGLAYLVYVWRVNRIVLSETSIVYNTVRVQQDVQRNMQAPSEPTSPGSGSQPNLAGW